MENIIAYCIVILAIAIFAGICRCIWTKFKKSRQEEAERQAKSKKYWADLRAEQNKVEVPDSMKKYADFLALDGSKTNIMAKSKPASASAGAPSTPPPVQMKKYSDALDRKWSTDQPPKRNNDSSDDGFLTGMIAGYAINSLINSVEEAREERSVGVRSSESSWGFEDSSSRKAVEDTFSSSSDSWSDSSDVSSDW